MAELKTLEIKFQDGVSEFKPGDVVKGEVVIETLMEMRMKGIRLRINGTANTEWEESIKHDGRKYAIVCAASEETYIQHEIVLFGRPTGAPGINRVFPVGLHVYPFSYKLPQNIPPTISGSFGSIRYRMDAIFARPIRTDYRMYKPIIVGGDIDLNREENATAEVRGDASKKPCSFFCTAGPITCNFKLDRAGYVPGESIVIQGEIVNRSRREIRQSTVTLLQEIGYTAKTHQRVETKKLVELKHGNTAPGCTDDWSGETITVPHLPPSRLTGCNIIKNKYFLEVSVLPVRPTSEIKFRMDVIIGTFPIVNGRGYSSQNTAEKKIDNKPCINETTNTEVGDQGQFVR